MSDKKIAKYREKILGVYYTNHINGNLLNLSGRLQEQAYEGLIVRTRFRILRFLMSKDKKGFEMAGAHCSSFNSSDFLRCTYDTCKVGVATYLETKNDEAEAYPYKESLGIKLFFKGKNPKAIKLVFYNYHTYDPLECHDIIIMEDSKLVWGCKI